jgi:hypothetical protein
VDWIQGIEAERELAHCWQFATHAEARAAIY